MSKRNLDDVDPFIDVKAVCLLLGVSKTFVDERLQHDPGFQKSRNGSTRAARWKHSDVLAYRDSSPEYCPESKNLRRNMLSA